MMSMQGPRSLSKACTSITALLKRDEKQNEFYINNSKSFSSCKLFLKYTHSHYRTLEFGTLGTGEKEGCFYVNTAGQCHLSLRHFRVRQHLFLSVPKQPWTLAFSFDNARVPVCPSCSQASQCSEMFVKRKYSRISGWSHKLPKPRCKSW